MKARTTDEQQATTDVSFHSLVCGMKWHKIGGENASNKYILGL